MQKTDWGIGIIAGIVLGILAVTSGLAQRVISAHASDTTLPIRELMLRSHTTWHSATGTAVTTWYAEGHTETWHTTFQIVQPNSGRVLWTTGADGKAFQWYGSKDGFYLVDPQEKIYTHLPVRNPTAFEMEMKTLPGTLDEMEPDTVYRHPFGAQIPSVLGDYLYPVGLVTQASEEYTSLGKDTLLGRTVYILEHQRTDGTGHLTAKSTYWVDSRTGIILKAVYYGGTHMQTIIEKTDITALDLDGATDTAVLRYTPAPGFEAVSPEVYFAQQH